MLGDLAAVRRDDVGRDVLRVEPVLLVEPVPRVEPLPRVDVLREAARARVDLARVPELRVELEERAGLRAVEVFVVRVVLVLVLEVSAIVAFQPLSRWQERMSVLRCLREAYPSNICT
ncbi:MAG: hypothetical protein QOF86_1877 [Baekduia sp.]|nr:hypothetical protein [Baekduia sp.]MEA2280754.1 hypothetical protein [Solirubrobacteraceae bacterium]